MEKFALDLVANVLIPIPLRVPTATLAAVGLES